MTLIHDEDTRTQAYGYLSCPDEISITLESDLFDDLMFGDDEVDNQFDNLTCGDDWKQLSRLLSLEGVANKAHQDLRRSRVSEHQDYPINSDEVNHVYSTPQHQERSKRSHEDSFTTPSAYYSPIVKRKRAASPNPVSCESSVCTQSSQSSDALPTPSVSSSTSTDLDSAMVDSEMLPFMSSEQLHRQLCYLAGRLARSMEKSEDSRTTLYREGLIEGERLWRNLDANRTQTITVQPQPATQGYMNEPYCTA